jgi:hypothetical protein
VQRVDLPMNNRWGEPPQPDEMLQTQATVSIIPDTHLPVPGVISPPAPGAFLSPKKSTPRATARREPGMTKDTMFVIKRGETYHVISEDYSYKTEPYYTILQHEIDGKTVRPSSRSVLDAFVVPICLEKLKCVGIPVCEWGISQAYVPFPSILYGLNYFATSSDYFVVSDNDQAKETIKHITNKGKYPFCYQKIDTNSTIHTCTAIFGRTIDSCNAVERFAGQIYDTFSIPLVRMVFVKTGKEFALSSLAPMRYNHLTEAERALLTAYLENQEFL